MRFSIYSIMYFDCLLYLADRLLPIAHHRWLSWLKNHNQTFGEQKCEGHHLGAGEQGHQLRIELDREARGPCGTRKEQMIHVCRGPEKRRVAQTDSLERKHQWNMSTHTTKKNRSNQMNFMLFVWFGHVCKTHFFNETSFYFLNLNFCLFIVTCVFEDNF